MNNKENKNWKSDIKNLIPSDIDFLSLIDRNIMLLIATITFLIANSLFYSYLYYGKTDLIADLEEEQKIANEKFITAQILSEKLDNVYNVFEKNLASESNDPRNKEANMLFLKDLTDILEKLEIKLQLLFRPKL